MKGWWSLPGGALETGERLEEGIRREVQEETGLDVRVQSFFTVFERIIPDASGRTEYHYVLMDYVCEIAGGEARAGSDVCALAWADETELAGYKLTEGTLPVIRAAFRKQQQA